MLAISWIVRVNVKRRDEINNEVICYLNHTENTARFFIVAPFDNQLGVCAAEVCVARTRHGEGVITIIWGA